MIFWKYVKKIFNIEYILIFISIVNFSYTLYFKSNAVREFNKLDEIISYIQLYDVKENLPSMYTDINSFCSGLEDEYLPFTYFNPELEKQLKEILFLLQDNSLTNEHEQIISVTMAFQNNMHINQRKLVFGYDSLLYCSLILLAIAIFVIIYNNMLQKNELNRLSAINNEQLKFSRNLHDGVAQDLAALKLYLQKDDKEKADFYASQSLSEIRFLIDSMHLNLHTDFEKIISETINTFQNNYKIETKLLIATTNLQKISQENQIEILRILQESLSNIARHANATKVTVKFTEVIHDINFIITDNGIGFSEDEVATKNQNDSKKHYGLINIKERVQNIGGTVEFINDGGTTIAICLKNIIH